MSCSLCGHEEEKRHHLGCVRIHNPDVSDKVLREVGLLPQEKPAKEPVADKVEVLRDGSMTTVPEGEDSAFGVCDFTGCDNPKYSASARAKWCDVHKDPNTRKE